MTARHLAGIFVLSAVLIISPRLADTVFAAADKVVATVKGEPIKASDVTAHMAATSLSRDDALADLIELKQLRIAAAANNVAVPPGSWSADDRAKVEAALFKARSLTVPPYVGDLVVDHAYVKTGEDEQGRKAGLALMERLRAMVEKGATIPEAYNRLQVDGSNWHIGDHEEYPVSALPDETRDVPMGGLTKVIATSDGYHLFRIYERKIPVEEIRTAVRIYLIEATFEFVNIIEE